MAQHTLNQAPFDPGSRRAGLWQFRHVAHPPSVNETKPNRGFQNISTRSATPTPVSAGSHGVGRESTTSISVRLEYAINGIKSGKAAFPRGARPKATWRSRSPQ